MKIGLDWGGTKLEAIALDPATNEELARNRIDSPKDDYPKIIDAVYNLILDTANNEKEIENVRKAFVDRQPMGRIGQPNEIAELAIYLASNESSFVTGQAISIDGGWTNT